MATIVVAVSNGAVRASISMAAKEAGHLVHAVGDAEELVTVVEASRPRLLFLDPGLARMDTVEPLRRLHWAGLLRELRVILVDDRCAEYQAWVNVSRQLVEGVIDSFRKDDIRWAIDGAIGAGKVPLAQQGPAPGARTASAPPPPPSVLHSPQAPPPPSRPSYGPPPPAPPMPARSPSAVRSGGPPTPSTPLRPHPPTLATPVRPPAAAPPAPPAPAATDRRDPTVLVVEDTPSLRALLGIRLESVGWKVKWAESAEEGLKKVETEGCDVLLSDVNLPGMSGDQFVAIVRKRFPGVRCLIMTALPKDHWPKVPREVPIFPKPIDMDALIRELAASLKPGRR